MGRGARHPDGAAAQDPRRPIRRKLAFFTGRDQMQALSGLWAQQFGTPNWAAHGGFCSVNMAVAGLYTIGYSFWEFGAPDWDHAKYFLLWGVAEDHSSNPIKIGLDKLKRRGAKFVSINPVRTGYSAIADEWVPIRPGHRRPAGARDRPRAAQATARSTGNSSIRYTNAPWLVVQTPGMPGDGLFARDADGQSAGLGPGRAGARQRPSVPTSRRRCSRSVELPDGRRAKTVFVADRRTLPRRALCARDAWPRECGVAAETITRLAHEMAHVAFNEAVELPIRWTDMHGRTHDKVVGRPVAMYAMRGISAHSNGFQTCRALHLIQMLLGALDGPGNFRARAPYPRRIPMRSLPENDPAVIFAPNTPLKRMPNGNPDAARGSGHRQGRQAAAHRPGVLVGSAAGGARPDAHGDHQRGQPRSLSDRHAAAVHGEHGVEFVDEHRRACARCWRARTRRRIRDSVPRRRRRVPVRDRQFRRPRAAGHDLSRALRRDLAARPADLRARCGRPMRSAIRSSTLDRDVRPWQDVLVELASRLKFPAFTREDGSRKFADYRTSSSTTRSFPGIGFLAGWRGEDGESHLRGEPNPKQWEKYIENQSFFTYPWPENMRYYRFANKDYLEFAEKHALFGTPPVQVILQMYSEPLQKFRLAGQGLYDGPQPTSPTDRERLATYFDPLPFWYEPLETPANRRATTYPFHAITQRPMMMYHSWDSQNAWLRQIIARELPVHESRHARRSSGSPTTTGCGSNRITASIRCQLKTMEGVEANTVWTWNAIGKQAGAWGLDAGRTGSDGGIPAQSPDLGAAAAGRRATSAASPTPIRSPARRRGSTCASASRKCAPRRNRRRGRRFDAGRAAARRRRRASAILRWTTRGR